MFGVFRLFLALLVVNGHLFKPWFPAGYAVYSFFMLSGYLMTLVMNTRYGYTRGGILRFGANRILRIYPPYLTAAALSVALLFLIPPEFVASVQDNIALPRTPDQIARNLLLLGLDRSQPVRLVPQAWALHVELIFYIAIGCCLGRSKRVATAWALLSLLYLLDLYFTGRAYFYLVYDRLASASFPFSLGSCLFHYRAEIGRLWAPGRWKFLFPVVLALYFGTFLLPLASDEFLIFQYGRLPFYLNQAMTFSLIAGIIHVPGILPRRILGMDQFFGDLSYPMYLFHWHGAILAAWFLEAPLHSTTLATFGGFIALAFSFVESRLITRRLEALRKRLRDRPKSPPRKSGSASSLGTST